MCIVSLSILCSRIFVLRRFFCFFFFNDTATTEIYTLSLHDALPICHRWRWVCPDRHGQDGRKIPDRKSTRLNSSHQLISYAVFCLKKKKKKLSKKMANRRKMRRTERQRTQKDT